MQVNDLINHLKNYAAQSPENAGAEVRLQFFDEVTYGIAGANDAKGVFPGHHLLLIVPDMMDKLGVRSLKMQ